MKTFDNHSSFSLALCIIFICFSAIRADSLSCYKVFRENYSLFILRNTNVIANQLDLTVMYKGKNMKGKLYYNLCLEFWLDNFCGDEEVYSNFIFINTIQKPGQPKCLSFHSNENNNWQYSNFSSKENQQKQDGISILYQGMDIKEHSIMPEIESPILKISDLVNNLEEDNKVLEMFNSGVENKIKDIPQFQIPKIELKLQTSKLFRRILTQNNNSDNKSKYLQVPVKEKLINETPQAKEIMMKLNQKLTTDVHNKMNEIVDQPLVKVISSDIQKDSLKIMITEPNDNKQNIYERLRILTKSEKKIVKPVIKEENIFKTEIIFYCDKEKETETAHFFPNEQKLLIDVYSTDGCVVNFEFLQLLNDAPIVTGLVFIIIGLGLAILGIKVYKNLMIVFIPMMLAILCFYLYFAFVENSTTSMTKILTLVGLLVFIFLLAVLMIWFNFLIYFLVSFAVSYQLGLVLKSLLEQNIEFFSKPYTEWIMVAILFVLFTILYIVAKDYFLIMSTAIMGSLFVVISLKYLGITTYDLLFDTQIEKFSEFQNLDPEAQKMTGVFLGVFLIGMIIQTLIHRRDVKKEEEKKEHSDVHDNGKNINIQLENI